MSRQRGEQACSDETCAEFMASRRGFMGGLALGGLTTVIGSASVTVGSSPALAASGDDAVLVIVSLRGAADGMSLVVPHGDEVYYQARPRIAVPRERLLAQDAFFGLHPAMAPMLPMWQSGSMAAVHATGLPAPNRSHFAAIEEVEDAQVGSAERSGWLNRLLGETANSAPTAAISVNGGTPPLSLRGVNQTMSVGSLASVTIAGEGSQDPRRTRRSSLNRMWGQDGSPMGYAMRGAMDAADRFSVAQRVQDNSASYPRSSLGKALSTAARTLRAGVGAQLITVDAGSWDMHANLGSLAGGRFQHEAADLAGSLAAFFDDLGAAASRTTVVTLSEFGRRTQENSAFGLDHGWGNIMLVAGAGVAGGTYHGRWPGLVNAADGDLTVTTDYRSVLAEVVGARFPSASLASVFPSFLPERVGVMTGR